MVALVREDSSRNGEEVLEPLVVRHGGHSNDRSKLLTTPRPPQPRAARAGRAHRAGAESTALAALSALSALPGVRLTSPHHARPTHVTAPMPAQAPSDAELIAAWRRGEEAAAAELVRRHARAGARFLS